MRYFSNILKIVLIGFLLWATGLFVYAIFSPPIIGEAYIGSFEVDDLSEGWTMISPDGETMENVILPVAGDVVSKGKTVTFENTLPEDVHSGMRLCVRTAMSDVKVAINGRLRSDYGKRNFLTKRVPMSTSVLLNLRDEDAGGKIEIFVTPSDANKGSLHSVTYAYGNNVWFPYIIRNIPFVAMGGLMILAGIAAIITFIVFFTRTGVNRSLLYLGILTAEMGMWMLGENQIRQLIFGSPFYANIFSYLFIETAAGFGALYFDEIQDHRYRRSYTVLIACLLLQLTVNSALNFLNLVDYFHTLKFSHVWTGMIILWIFVTVVMDIRYHRIKDYRITVIGMIGMLVTGLMEIAHYYIVPTAKLGAFIGFGLIFLLGMTLLQTFKNILSASEEQRMYSEKINERILHTLEDVGDTREGAETAVSDHEDNDDPKERPVHVAVVDDVKANLIAAGRILSDNGMDVTCVTSGEKLLECVEVDRPDIILLDIYMPGMDGFETLEKLRAMEEGNDEIPVIFLTGSEDYKYETKGLKLGAMDFIKKPFDPDVLTLRVKNTVELVRLQKNLSSEVQKKSKENESLAFHVVQTLAEAIDAKDTYTNGHSTRVAQYSREIARRYGYSQKDQDDIYMMGLLHDVGKIGVPDEVINKTSKLTDEEYEIIKKHPSIGANILEKIKERPRLQIGAHWHHERYDGKGYPDGLAGTDIPEEARIIAVADAYDAMTSYRSYRDVLPQAVVAGEIEKGKGKQFDPIFADIMLGIISEDVVYGLREKRDPK